MTKDLTDMRCGDGWMSLPKDDPMYIACAQHDLDYIEGGSDEDKKAAEENFDKNCHFIARQTRTLWTWIEQYVLPPVAKFLGKFYWRRYSRIDDYIEQGKEHGKGND